MYEKIYGIYDFKAEQVIGPLMFFPSDPAACRMFTDVCRDPKGQVYAHPEDYALVWFGTLIRRDNLGSTIEPVERPLAVPILSGLQVVAVDNAREAQRQEQLSIV